ncbi:hypothetical protein [Rhizobium sp. RAF56]|jgi:hypothetical protein|uniref:hypothetical protein n=1 Tax=Rhizobium sp. RAF56 TaxID=3233062 RepID=UPI003F9C7D0C
MSVTRNEAIRRLDAAGQRKVATELNQWRNNWGNTGGWGGWFRGQYPDLINTVWTA